MIIGLLTALLAAACYGVAAVLQSLAARAQPDDGGVDARLLVRLARSGPFIAGVVLDLVAFVAQFIALRTLVVFVVQAVQASNLAVTAVVAIPVLGVRLKSREWAAIAAVCVGLATLALGAGSERAETVGLAVKWGLVAGAVATIALGFLVGQSKARMAPVALGFIAGIGFGVAVLAARIITNLSLGHLIRDPAVLALALGGIVSFLFYTTALQRGVVTTVTAAVIIGETLLPALIGIVVLGDRPRPGYAPLAILGFAVAVTGALLLARFGEIAAGHAAAAHAADAEKAASTEHAADAGKAVSADAGKALSARQAAEGMAAAGETTIGDSTG